jgi:3-phenylpropionate/trans-cinnamate dioxygenase ferredoxin reductase component
MAEQTCKYLIIGGGLAGASAVKGIREIDKAGSVVLVGSEKHLPYDRPPLSKKLWFGTKKVEEIFIHGNEFYSQNNVELMLGVSVIALDARQKRVTTDSGLKLGYEKLLIATGGAPRKLSIPGGDLDGVCYYRYLDDYLRIRSDATEGRSAVIIGGGFIGSEVAAALNINKIDVTMVFPGEYLVDRVFPENLGRAIQKKFIERGVKILGKDKPVSISRNGSRFMILTEGGKKLESDVVIVGVGIEPTVKFAEEAGLKTAYGLVVDEYLRTTDPDIYAAGDNALFPYKALGKTTRLEHWDNALNQGAQAGRNMAGANEAYTYMPYFFSDLFDFGYEAVGEISSSLETFADWQKEFETGVIYYLKDGIVVGAMMCNVWEKVDEARELIKSRTAVVTKDLRGAIR